MRLAALTVAAVTLLPSVAAAGRGVFIPPMRIDVGPSISHAEPAAQVVAGIHWASVYPSHRANIDIGVGMISASSFGDEAAGAGGAAERTIAPQQGLELVGGYVEVATRVAGAKWWRTWIGTRVESGRATLDGRPEPFVGVATRASTEIFVAGADGGGSAVMMGVFAIGVYGEIAVRRIDDVGDDLGASVGLSMRLPLIIAN